MKEQVFLLLSAAIGLIAVLHAAPVVLYNIVIYGHAAKGRAHSPTVDLIPLAYLAFAWIVQHRWRKYDESIVWVCVSLATAIISIWALPFVARHWSGRHKQSRRPSTVCGCNQRSCNPESWTHLIASDAWIRMFSRSAVVLVPVSADIVMALYLVKNDNKAITRVWIGVMPALPFFGYLSYMALFRFVLILSRKYMWHRRRVRGACLLCRYDLSGSDGAVCPECGSCQYPSQVVSLSEIG